MAKLVFNYDLLYPVFGIADNGIFLKSFGCFKMTGGSELS